LLLLPLRTLLPPHKLLKQTMKIHTKRTSCNQSSRVALVILTIVQNILLLIPSTASSPPIRLEVQYFLLDILHVIRLCYYSRDAFSFRICGCHKHNLVVVGLLFAFAIVQGWTGMDYLMNGDWMRGPTCIVQCVLLWLVLWSEAYRDCVLRPMWLDRRAYFFRVHSLLYMGGGGGGADNNNDDDDDMHQDPLASSGYFVLLRDIDADWAIEPIVEDDMPWPRFEVDSDTPTGCRCCSFLTWTQAYPSSSSPPYVYTCYTDLFHQLEIDGHDRNAFLPCIRNSFSKRMLNDDDDETQRWYYALENDRWDFKETTTTTTNDNDDDCVPLFANRQQLDEILSYVSDPSPRFTRLLSVAPLPSCVICHETIQPSEMICQCRQCNQLVGHAQCICNYMTATMSSSHPSCILCRQSMFLIT
jgi:hypothetical protein